MSDDSRAADEERLRKLRRVHMHRWDVSSTDEPELFFLLRVLDARDAALREAETKALRYRNAFAALCAVLDIPSYPLDWDRIRSQAEAKFAARREARAEIERLRAVAKAASAVIETLSAREPPLAWTDELHRLGEAVRSLAASEGGER